MYTSWYAGRSCRQGPSARRYRSRTDHTPPWTTGVWSGSGTTAEHIAALHAALKDAKFVPPAPKHTDLLPAATEKLPCYLPTDAGHGPVLTAGPDLEDRLADALDGSEPMVALRVAAWEDIDALTDVQYLLSKPLCLVCDDAELLEAALRAYQGRALYEGALPESALLPLCGRYGLLI